MSGDTGRAPNALLQDRILLRLDEAPVSTVSELGRQLGSPRPSVSRAASVLRRLGLVRDGEDGLELTEDGRAELDLIARRPVPAKTAQADSLERIASALERIADAAAGERA